MWTLTELHSAFIMEKSKEQGDQLGGHILDSHDRFTKPYVYRSDA